MAEFKNGILQFCRIGKVRVCVFFKTRRIGYRDCAMGTPMTPLRSAVRVTRVVTCACWLRTVAVTLTWRTRRTEQRSECPPGVAMKIFKILFKAGANVSSVDKQGRTSLTAASSMSQVDIVKILLEIRAYVNLLDLNGRSVRCMAGLCGSSGYSQAISTLLDHGADIDQLDNLWSERFCGGWTIIGRTTDVPW